ncbi:hypothetical protein FHS80_000288 [Porphyromonas circumdentaria]|nr:hypothetical protein [Porphyromonas circumdentaria]
MVIVREKKCAKKSIEIYLQEGGFVLLGMELGKVFCH